MKPQEIRTVRNSLGLSQADLGERLHVSQVTVSNWERGKATLAPEQARALSELADKRLGREEVSFGDWVAQQRSARGLSRTTLAAKAGISEIQVYNIETGRTTNPREKTRAGLQKVLGKTPEPVVEAAEKAAEIAGVGQLTDFNPHDDNDFPSEPGVYVFYDISGRPIYVGQSSNIKRRIGGHTDKFWYKSPIVETAAYVKVDDTTLRMQLEETLIKFLKSSAVINKKGVDRSRA